MPIGLRRERRAGLLGKALSIAICAVASLVFAGWVLESQGLKALGGAVEMKANTALALLLLGLSLALLATGPATASQRRWIARALASGAGLIGLVTLLEYFSGNSFGLDDWMFPDPGNATPGRMALMTAVDLVLIAAAIWMVDIKFRHLHPTNWLALAVAVNAYAAILGYLYGVDSFYRVAAATAMALHTATLLLASSVAVVLVRPGSRLMRRILRDDAAGIVNRRLLPVALLTPPTLAWIVLIGERQGVYGTTFAMLLTAMSTVAILVALVWWSAASMQQLRSGQHALEQANAWQQGMLDSANFTVIATDTSGLIRNINAGAAQLLGYRPEELEGVATPECLHDRDEITARADALSQELGYEVPAGFETFVAKARVGRCDENDWTYIRKDGRRFPVRLSVTALRDDNGELTGFLGVGYDITLQKQAEARLVQMARSDALTGLANRAHFEEYLTEAIERCDRSGNPMALLFLDLDSFKSINDSLGHHCGDLVLQEFSRRLLAAVRTTDLVARLSGDEFVIVLEALMEADGNAFGDAAMVAEAIIAAMREPMMLEGEARVVSASIGVAVRRPHGVLGAELLINADAALYVAKRRGGGYECHESAMGSENISGSAPGKSPFKR
jgi:diguanylate cyclase (GGDEF)-like protein/PAS domain S-box-containing protein